MLEMINDVKTKKNKKDDNVKKLHIIAKKDKLKKDYKEQKRDTKLNFKKAIKEYASNFKKEVSAIKKNKKDFLKFKKESALIKTEIVKKYKTSLNDVKTNYIVGKNNLRLEILDAKVPISLKNSNDKTNNLLLQKQKEKRNKLLLVEKEKKDYKTIFKNLPIRLFKEMRRVRWGSADSKIGIKFIQVLFLVITSSLFIWGIEELLALILKLLKITSF